EELEPAVPGPLTLVRLRAERLGEGRGAARPPLIVGRADGRRGGFRPERDGGGKGDECERMHCIPPGSCDVAVPGTYRERRKRWQLSRWSYVVRRGGDAG